MSQDSIKAFSDSEYDYYRLTQDLGGILPEGTIFYHDVLDRHNGSIALGCLKSCWTQNGGTYGTLAGGSVIFHAKFINSDLFEKVDSNALKMKDTLTKVVHDLKEQLRIAEKALKEFN